MPTDRGLDTLTPSISERDVAQDWTMSLLFPCLIVGLAFAQARTPPMPIVLAIGQAASLLAIALSIVLIVRALPGSIWPATLIGVLMALGGVRFAVVESTVIDGAYAAAVVVLVSAASALIVVRRPGLQQRQFAIFCAISVPLMFLQILGVPWSHLLRTDLAQPGSQHALVRTLFVTPGQLVFNSLQAQPSGILSSHNAASVVTAFGLALHYGRRPRPARTTWADLAVLTAAALLMAKVTFVLLIVLWLVRAGMGPDSRRDVLASVTTMVALLASYGVLFPGLFVHNVSWNASVMDAQAQLAAVLIATGVPAFVDLAGRFPSEVLQRLGTGTQSAYTLVLEQARTLLPSFMLSVPYAWIALKTMRRFDPGLKHEVAAVAIAFVIVLSVTPFATTGAYWFLAGAALLPLWQAADPAFCRSSPTSTHSALHALMRRSHWIVLAAVLGTAIGRTAMRAVTPVYQATATLSLKNASTSVQAMVTSASVEAVLRDRDVAADVGESSGVQIRRMWAQPADVNEVVVFVQAYGDAARVRNAAKVAASRAASWLNDNGADRARGLFAALSGLPTDRWQLLQSTADAVFGVGVETGRRQGRIDEQVSARVPAPIIATANSWYDVPVRLAGDPSPAVLMRQRFMLAGFLIGTGIGLFFFACRLALARLRAEPVDPIVAGG